MYLLGSLIELNWNREFYKNMMSFLGNLQNLRKK